MAQTKSTPALPPDVVSTGDPFTDRARELGIDFEHFNGMSGEYYLSEVMGAGAAFLDYDRDGDLDVYLVQGNRLDPGEGHDPSLSDRLFRNELVETGSLSFRDVTKSSGIVSPEYGMGVAVGDYDNDGHPDFYVTDFGGTNRMFRNTGDGRFEDATLATGTAERRWSTSAAFLDYDRDGWLDLFVTNYVDFNLNNNKECSSASTFRDYCTPLTYRPYPDRLFRNRGDGTFEDVSIYSRVATEYGAALGVLETDVNADGRPDIYVANDASANLLWVNQGDGRFSDQALISGSAYNDLGKAEGSMGVDAADFDGDGDEDLFLTHLNGETNTLYVNGGTGFFEDQSSRAGLGAPSLAFTGFGTAFLDYDNDGWPDILVVNGAVTILDRLARARDPHPLHQPNQLFRNLGNGRFEEATDHAGEAFRLSEVSRGAAVGDVDNDGDADILIANNNGPARLLINQRGNRNVWLGLRLVTGVGRRDAYGAMVGCRRASGTISWRRVRAGASYCSSNDPRILFGLGPRESVESIQVRWPDGQHEQWDWSGRPLRRYVTLEQGTGEAVP